MAFQRGPALHFVNHRFRSLLYLLLKVFLQINYFILFGCLCVPLRVSATLLLELGSLTFDIIYTYIVI